jgi:hypothetical protein
MGQYGNQVLSKRNYNEGQTGPYENFSEAFIHQ